MEYNEKQIAIINAATKLFGEKGFEGRLHPHHLRLAADHGRPAGLLQKAGVKRYSQQDRWLGIDSWQDAQQRAWCLTFLVANANRHVNGPWVWSKSNEGGYDSER